MYRAVSAAPLQSHFRRAAVIIPLLYPVKDSERFVGRRRRDAAVSRRTTILTAAEKPVDASMPPTLKKDWRFYAGMTAMVLAVVMPLCALVVPMLGLSTTQSALLAGCCSRAARKCSASSRS